MAKGGKHLAVAACTEAGYLSRCTITDSHGEFPGYRFKVKVGFAFGVNVFSLHAISKLGNIVETSCGKYIETMLFLDARKVRI